MTRGRPRWMDEPHEFAERADDYSMCRCGIPMQHHETWEREQWEDQRCNSG